MRYFKSKQTLLRLEADAISTRSTAQKPCGDKACTRSHNIATPFLPRPLALQPRRHGRADAVYWRLPQYDFILFTLL
jgi:hypothetical protein